MSSNPKHIARPATAAAKPLTKEEQAAQIARFFSQKKDLPLMGGNTDLYFDEWNQSQQNPTKRQCFEEGIRYAERLQKEQKPAEWSEDYREEGIQTRFAFYTYKDDLGTLYLSNVFVEEASRNHGFGTRILIAAEKVAETIGATTISLKVKQDSPANAWYRKNGYGYVAFEDGYDWLEKNLEYMKPNKQEWSEEDDRILTGIIERGSSQIPPHEPALRGEQMEWLMNRLKSLRPWRRRMPDNDTSRNLSYNDLMELYKAVRDEIKRRTNSVESNIVEKRWSASE